MSTTTDGAAAVVRRTRENATIKEDRRENAKNYRGFVAGVFSGIAKLTG